MSPGDTSRLMPYRGGLVWGADNKGVRTRTDLLVTVPVSAGKAPPGVVDWRDNWKPFDTKIERGAAWESAPSMGPDGQWLGEWSRVPEDIQVTCPIGAHPGDEIGLDGILSNGTLDVVVPENVEPGGTFSVALSMVSENGSPWWEQTIAPTADDDGAGPEDGLVRGQVSPGKLLPEGSPQVQWTARCANVAKDNNGRATIVSSQPRRRAATKTRERVRSTSVPRSLAYLALVCSILLLFADLM